MATLLWQKTKTDRVRDSVQVEAEPRTHGHQSCYLMSRTLASKGRKDLEEKEYVSFISNDIHLTLPK